MKKIIGRTAIGLLVTAGLLFAGFATLVSTSNSDVDLTDPVGLTSGTVVDASRNRELAYYIWYPTNVAEEVALFDENIVFRGFSAIEGAPIEEGSYPLIVMSHGSGGNRANQGWLAAELVREGAIVVAVNHPGSMSMDSAPETNILAWNRPEDLSFLLDKILADPEFGPLIDADRIAAIGHSLGGYTVLATGGMEIEMGAFIDYCDEFPNNADCSFYQGGGVDFNTVDRTQFEQSHKDERIKAIVSIDPAYARSFDPASLDALPNTLLIRAGLIHSKLGDLQGGYLGENLEEKGHQYLSVDEAHHFTYLQECKPIGWYLLGLVEENGQFLCSAEDGASRAEIHDQTAQLIIEFLIEYGIY